MFTSRAKRIWSSPKGSLEVFSSWRVLSIAVRLKGVFRNDKDQSLVRIGLQRLLTVALMCSVLSALADEPDRGVSGQVHTISIKDKTLDKALNRLATQTGAQMLFRHDDVRDLPAPNVEGRYTLKQALDLLLAESRLEGRSVGDVITISLPHSTNRWGAPMLREDRLFLADGSSAKRRPLATVIGAALAALLISPAGAAAEQESDKIKELDTIMVTADRRGEQRAIDTPLSISAFDGTWLEDRGYSGLNDFIQFSPGVSMNSPSPGANYIQMRGLSVGVGEANVGYYLDEVPIAFINQMMLPDIRAFDMERIEILRGPQSTLYGAGALAGVVRAVTQAPKLDAYEFKSDFTLSSTKDGGDNYSAAFAGNLPLVTDRVGLRLAYLQEDNSGWIDQTLLDKKDSNSSDLNMFRAKLLAKVTDNLTVSALYWGSRIGATGTSASYPDRTADEESAGKSNYDYDIYNLTLDYQGESFGLVSSTSRAKLDNAMENDFLMGYSLVTLLNPVAFTQEVRAYSTHEGNWQWSAGAFYRDSDQTQIQDSALFPVLGLDPVMQYDQVESTSVFAEITRKMYDEKLALTLGGRYLQETRTTEQRFVPSEPFSNKFEVFTPRVNLSYRPTGQWMTYFNYSQGFRSGINQFAVSLETAAALGVLLPSAAEQETADSYELGLKGAFFDNRLTVDLAAFKIKWNDMQAFVPIVSGVLGGVLNAASASSPGFEFALNWKASNDLRFGVSGSWNDAKIDKDVFTDAVVPDPITGLPGTDTEQVLVFARGTRINEVPEWTGAMTADYSHPILSDRYLFVARGGAQYASYRPNIGIGTAVRGDNILTVDLRAGIENVKWGAYVFINNASDDDGMISAYGGARSQWGSHNRPRTIGLNFKYFY